MKNAVIQLYIQNFAQLAGIADKQINKKFLERKMGSIWNASTIRHFKKEGNSLCAFFAVCEVPRIDDVNKNCHLVVYGHRDGQFSDWIQTKFLQYKRRLKNESIIEAFISDRELSRFFTNHGFFIESVGSFGQVNKAIRILEKSYPNLNSYLNEQNLELEPLISRKDIPRLVEIWKEVFIKNPEFFYCGSRRSYLKNLREILEEALRHYIIGDGNKMIYLFKRDGKILGFCDTGVYSTPWSTRSGGTQFCLLPELRGKKLGAYAYYLMLQDLKFLKAETFSGNTANRAVMSLSKKLKRIPTSFLLIKGDGYFEPDYFFNFVDELNLAW